MEPVDGKTSPEMDDKTITMFTGTVHWSHRSFEIYKKGAMSVANCRMQQASLNPSLDTPGVTGLFLSFNKPRRECNSLPENAASVAENATRLAENATRLTENASRLVENASCLAKNATSLVENATRLAENATSLAENASRLAENASRLVENASRLTDDSLQW
ncbi:uncharacterized protein [Asterias amurensis]|uniref:uncharacterized protein n=1 Tax=Asterias amurensis TaxID=7602 RepID=UPI003AB8A82D